MHDAQLNPYESPQSNDASHVGLRRYLRYAMIVLTLLYMLSIVAMVGIVFVAEMRSGKFEELPGGRVRHVETGQIQPRNHRLAAVATTSLWGGLCCPTVPYALLMAALSGLLLITKKKR